MNYPAFSGGFRGFADGSVSVGFSIEMGSHPLLRLCRKASYLKDYALPLVLCPLIRTENQPGRGTRLFDPDCSLRWQREHGPRLRRHPSGVSTVGTLISPLTELNNSRPHRFQSWPKPRSQSRNAEKVQLVSFHPDFGGFAAKIEQWSMRPVEQEKQK